MTSFRISRTFFLLSISILLGLDFCQGQSSTIVDAWSENSINAVVFRKNSVVSFKNFQFATFYDPQGNVILAKRQLGTTAWEIRKLPYTGDIKDAHRSISLMIDGNGFIHLAWNHHDSKLLYCKSQKPLGLEFSAPTPMIGTLEDRVTYPEFYRFPNGDLFFLYREGSSGNGSLVINRYLTAAEKWERVHEQIIEGEKSRNAYWQACTDSEGTFHISWVWRENYDVASNHDICYARTRDFGASWQRSDGKDYALPITLNAAEYVARIPENSSLINQTSMFADQDGIPYIATYFISEGNTVPQYYLFHLDKYGWKKNQISRRKTSFSLGGGGTRKIPISRPQLMIDEQAGGKRAYLIFRDAAQGNRPLIMWGESPDFLHWKMKVISDESLESWEPTYDTELWKSNRKLHLFVQKVGQGDGESLENIPPQPVRILEVETPN